MPGRFFTTSNDKTVARYSLAVTFEYNGTTVKIEEIKAENLPSINSSSWVYKSYTINRYFYLIETGEKVADYSLEATFRYDTAGKLAECRTTQTYQSSVDG